MSEKKKRTYKRKTKRQVEEISESKPIEPEIEEVKDSNEDVGRETNLSMEDLIPAGNGGEQVAIEPTEKITMQNTAPIRFAETPAPARNIKKKTPILFMSALPTRRRR